MALTPNFTANQLSSDPSSLLFTDTSTGTDGTIVNRRIYVKLANGNYLTSGGVSTTAAYDNWTYSDLTITLSLLPRSESPTITIEFWNSTALVYTITKDFCFDFGDYIFGLGLTMMQVANNNIVQDYDWYANKMKLIVNTQDAETAILYNDDILLSQNSLDRNWFMIQKQSTYWGN